MALTASCISLPCLLRPCLLQLAFQQLISVASSSCDHLFSALHPGVKVSEFCGFTPSRRHRVCFTPEDRAKPVAQFLSDGSYISCVKVGSFIPLYS